MKAGRELDALVAEKVMGWRKIDRIKAGWGKGPQVWDTGEDPEQEHSSPTYQNFRPSESIKDAWVVVEQMEANKWEFCAVGRSSNGRGAWFCEFGKQFQLSNSEVIAYADTAPLAICLASLKAMEIQREACET